MLVIARMTILICYFISPYGAHTFFLPGAHILCLSMLGFFCHES